MRPLLIPPLKQIKGQNICSIFYIPSFLLQMLLWRAIILKKIKEQRTEQKRYVSKIFSCFLTYQISNSVGSSNETKYQKSCDAQLEREGKEDGFLEKALKHIAVRAKPIQFIFFTQNNTAAAYTKAFYVKKHLFGGLDFQIVPTFIFFRWN